MRREEEKGMEDLSRPRYEEKRRERGGRTSLSLVIPLRREEEEKRASLLSSFSSLEITKPKEYSSFSSFIP